MRAILFCNEMLGLGHLRRSLVIAEALTTHGGRDDAALVVTGSPAFGGMPAPKGVDILKIPSAPVTADSRWSATVFRPTSGLSAGAAEVLALRAELARTSVEQFRPDIVISDQRPFGRERDFDRRSTRHVHWIDARSPSASGRSTTRASGSRASGVRRWSTT